MQQYWSPAATPMPPSYQVRPIIDWAIGKAGADAYPMAPNSKVMLLDTQDPVMYVKATDAVGRASIVIYDLVERQPVNVADAAPMTPAIDYDKIRSIIADEVKKQTGPATQSAKKTKKEDES